MWWVLAIAGAIVLVDQTTKSVAIRFLSPGGPAAPGAVGLSLAANRNWWLGGGSPTAPMLVALWAAALGCTALVLVAGADSASDQLASAGLVVALAGATSNLCDRVRRGAVVDFIALGRWPTFNLADVAIVAGVALALGTVL